jgi:signal transduction histidine kinase
MNHSHQFYPNKDIQLDINTALKNVEVIANGLLLDVFENIINNAIKYNENQIVKILIKISKEIIDDIKYIRLEFLDNGIGISDEKKSIIFQKGYKEIKGGKGMGMGLSLVKILITRYNGKIWIEDRIKGDYTKGSNFILLIPESI